ncbi:MAG: hypothetical protein JSR25_11095 [Proteobacteria bacterium]|nr:hypothetical protein [Pseudomonadota bacterium]
MRLGFLLLTAAVTIGLSGPVLSQGRRMEDRAPGVQPLDRILPEVRRSHPGEFYDADGPTTGPGGSEHYHLKWMRPDGRVEWLDTDARTGRVLGSSPGRDNFDGPGQRRNYEPAPSMPTPQSERRDFGGPGGGDYGNRGFGGRRDFDNRGEGFGGSDFGGRRDFGGRGGFGGRGDFGGRDFGGRGRGRER